MFIYRYYYLYQYFVQNSILIIILSVIEGIIALSSIHNTFFNEMSFQKRIKFATSKISFENHDILSITYLEIQNQYEMSKLQNVKIGS